MNGDAQIVHVAKNGYTDLKAYIRRRNALKVTCTQETNRFLAKVCLYFPDLLKVFPSGRATLKAIFSIYPTPYSIIEADFDELVSVLQKASKNKFGVDKANELIHALHVIRLLFANLSQMANYTTFTTFIDSIDSLESEIRNLEKIIDSKVKNFLLIMYFLH